MKSNLDHNDMRMIAELLNTMMPPNWGFTLLTFETNNDAGAEVFYISSAERDSMVGTMQTMLNKWKAMESFKDANPN